MRYGGTSGTHGRYSRTAVRGPFLVSADGESGAHGEEESYAAIAAAVVEFEPNAKLAGPAGGPGRIPGGAGGTELGAALPLGGMVPGEFPA